jgi:eukaryotic-like serine/threonine-protein kinase
LNTGYLAMKIIIQQNMYRTIAAVLLLADMFLFSATISYKITLAGEMSTIPDITGTTMKEAREILQSKKLFPAQNSVELHPLFEKGQIISQNPSAGSKVKLYKTVEVVVSAGREKVIVPDITGRTLENINPALQETGLYKGKTSHVHTPAYAAGKIISQSPPPGEEVAVDSKLSLLVSQGALEPRFLMPDLLGKRASIIIEQLKERGFRIGDIRRSYYPGLDGGIIINQNPQPGNRIQKRNVITLEVSK